MLLAAVVSRAKAEDGRLIDAGHEAGHDAQVATHASHAGPASEGHADPASEGVAHLPDLATQHRDITTPSAVAQRFFDQGLTLLYGFDQELSQRSFEEAARADPSCAMCFWGIAAALGPNINVPITAEREAAAHRAAARALELAPGASAVERALIEAMALRYGAHPEPHAERADRDRAYAEAMRAVAGRFPDDPDVLTLYADSLMLLTPWDYWTKSGEPKSDDTLEMVAVLERALAVSPNHAGANHFYIHAVEASNRPERAVASARRLERLVPGSGHLLHMPSHVYLRLGWYEDAVRSNEAAVAADERYEARIRPGPIYAMYAAHDLQFLAAAAMMAGDAARALSAARALRAELPLDVLEHRPSMTVALAYPALVLLRFGCWNEVLAEPAPPERFRFATTMWTWARGVALARLGRVDAAAEVLARLRALADGTPDGATIWFSSERALAGIARAVLEAEIAAARGEVDRAIGLFREAVRGEDELGYMEPPGWYYPVRQMLGALLLDEGRADEAETIFREDLEKNPENPWSLVGLSRSLRARGRVADAEGVEQRLRRSQNAPPSGGPLGGEPAPCSGLEGLE